MISLGGLQMTVLLGSLRLISELSSLSYCVIIGKMRSAVEATCSRGLVEDEQAILVRQSLSG